MIIYKVTSPSGKIYIGQTQRTLNERKKEHLKNASSINYKSYNTPLSRSIRKYKDKLVWEVLFDIPWHINSELRNRIEILSIKAHNSFENGYNCTLGGEGSKLFKHSKESIEKMCHPRKNFPREHNVNATIYTILSPDKIIYKFNGRKEVVSYFGNISIIKHKKRNGWKLIKSERLNVLSA